MTDIKNNGCPPGIEALEVEATDTWIFKVSVLGDETVYRVRRTYKPRSRVPQYPPKLTLD